MSSSDSDSRASGSARPDEPLEVEPAHEACLGERGVVDPCFGLGAARGAHELVEISPCSGAAAAPSESVTRIGWSVTPR
jgi:hypothetical protein